VYVTPADVLTSNLLEAAPDELVVVVHIVTPLTVMVTVAPETALPPLVTLTFRITGEPFSTLAPFAGLVGVTVNDFITLNENYCIATYCTTPEIEIIRLPCLAIIRTGRDGCNRVAALVRQSVLHSDRCSGIELRL